MIIISEVPWNPCRILIQKYPPQLLRSHTGHRWEIRAYFQAFLAKKGVVDRFGLIFKFRFEAGEQNEGKVVGDIVVGIGVHCGQWSSFAVAEVKRRVTKKSITQLGNRQGSGRGVWLESVLFRVETCILR